MRTSIKTTANPLILNFMAPETPKTLSASEMPIYDPVQQITHIMGGGNGGKKTRSQQGWDRTETKYSGSTVYQQNDAPHCTDD